MKQIYYPIISIIILFFLNSCAGYKPIFGSSDLQFKIAEHSIEGNEKLGNLIYSKLYNISKTSKKGKEIRNINININVSKEKNSTAKDSTGKVLEYKISLNTRIIIINDLTDENLLDQNFISSSSYKVQDQHSETIKLENKITNDLINKTFQDILIKISGNVLKT